MVLFTKEVFLQLKTLINMHVNVTFNEYAHGDKQSRSETWQIYIQGLVGDGTNHLDSFQVYMTMDSKEEAYRVFKELAKQVVDSGEVPVLNAKLIDEVLTKEE